MLCTHIVSEVHPVRDIREVVANVLRSLGRLLAASFLILFVLLLEMLHEARSILLGLLVHHTCVYSWEGVCVWGGGGEGGCGGVCRGT